MIRHISIYGALLGALGLTLLPGSVAMAASESPADAARTVVVKDLIVQEGSISGTVVNKSPATLRGVEMLLHQDWQWSNERHPGAESPGRSMPFTLAGDVAPNASAPFTFQTPRLPQRSDGRFVTTMDVVRFTEVGP